MKNLTIGFLIISGFLLCGFSLYLLVQGNILSILVMLFGFISIMTGVFKETPNPR